MDTQQLYSKFSHAIGWNSFLFIIQKTLFVCLSFLLYKNLTTQDFSLWANSNSIIFLLLLWLDFGFRKSLPRYAPEFAATKKTISTFISYVLYFKIGLLLFVTPFFFWCAPYFSKIIGLEKSLPILYLASILFFLEGIISIIRLIFHSYFWQKQFNLLSSFVLTIKMAINLILIAFACSSKELLLWIFIIKIIADLIIILFSSIILLKKEFFPTSTKTNAAKKINFIKHSGIMWANTSLKSLTERNFLVPLFTTIFGPAAANTFKIANDGALFFQRIVIKTIGTADTSLLSHIEAQQRKTKVFQQAFRKITTKIASFTIPLVVIAFVFAPKILGLFFSAQAFKLFFIIVISYLIHALFSPYERVLEVKRDYTALLIAYSPYVFLIIIFLWLDLITSIGLVWSIIIVHIVRLVSALIILVLAKKRYQLIFPLRFTLSLFGITLVLSFLVSWVTTALFGQYWRL